MCTAKKPQIQRAALGTDAPAGFTTPDQMLGLNQSASTSASAGGRNALRIDQNAPQVNATAGAMSENDVVTDPNQIAKQAAYDAETGVLAQQAKHDETLKRQKNLDLLSGHHVAKKIGSTMAARLPKLFGKKGRLF